MGYWNGSYFQQTSPTIFTIKIVWKPQITVYHMVYIYNGVSFRHLQERYPKQIAKWKKRQVTKLIYHLVLFMQNYVIIYVFTYLTRALICNQGRGIIIIQNLTEPERGSQPS